MFLAYNDCAERKSKRLVTWNDYSVKMITTNRSEINVLITLTLVNISTDGNVTHSYNPLQMTSGTVSTTFAGLQQFNPPKCGGKFFLDSILDRFQLKFRVTFFCSFLIKWREKRKNMQAIINNNSIRKINLCSCFMLLWV